MLRQKLRQGRCHLRPTFQRQSVSIDSSSSCRLSILFRFAMARKSSSRFRGRYPNTSAIRNSGMSIISR